MENLDGSGRVWRRHDVPNGPGPRRGAYHSLFVGDLDGDGDLDIVSAEMEAVGGHGSPRWYLWENLDGAGGQWREHVILDANLGGHEVMVGDLTGNGRPDLISKPWRPRPGNVVAAVGRCVTGFEVGDAVAFWKGWSPYPGVGSNGGFAELMRAPAEGMWKTPEGNGQEEATQFETICTPMSLVRDNVGVKAGECVVVSGAGMIGLLAANVAKITV